MKKILLYLTIIAVILSSLNITAYADNNEQITATDYKAESLVEIIGKIGETDADVSCMAVNSGMELAQIGGESIKYIKTTKSDSKGNFEFKVLYDGACENYDFYVNYSGKVEKVVPIAADKTEAVLKASEQAAKMEFPYSRYSAEELNTLKENYKKACLYGAIDEDFDNEVLGKLKDILLFANSELLNIDYKRDAFYDDKSDLYTMDTGFMYEKCASHDNCIICTALNGENMKKKLASDGYLYINNVPIKFGAVTGNEKNAISTEDVKGRIELSLDGGFYEVITLVMNAQGQHSNVKTVIEYADGTQELTSLDKVYSFRYGPVTDLKKNESYIGEITAHRTAHSNEDKNKYGSYNGYLYSYTIKPSRLEKVTKLTVLGREVVLYGATAVKKDISAKEIFEMINSLPERITVEDKDRIEQIGELL